jgi:hypothetical protein
MPAFNTQQEIWAHLVNGGVVTDIISDTVYKFIDGKLVYFCNDLGVYESSNCGFLKPEYFAPVKHWYDELANRPILCWVSDTQPDKKSVALICEYIPTITYPYRPANGGSPWLYATPLNDDDIESYFYRK